MYKIVPAYSEVRDENHPLNAKHIGAFNDSPPNVELITEDQFIHWNYVYLPKFIEHRQITRGKLKELIPDGGAYLQVVIYWYPGNEGYGIVTKYEGYKGGHTNWDRKYFKCAICKHKMVGIPEESRMCFHVSRCSKCGFRSEVDSSD